MTDELQALETEREALAAEYLAVESQRLDIETQVATAEARGLGLSGRDWHVRAIHSLKSRARTAKVLKLQIDAIDRKIGQLRWAAKVAHNSKREQLFIQAAKQLLTPAMYLRLWDAVHTSMQGDSRHAG